MIAVGAVAKQADYRGVLALDDLNDSPFRASVRTATLDSRQHPVSVHRVFEAVATDEKVTIDLRDRFVRHHESVAIAVRDESPRY
jgi:hypothetical protein